MDDAVRSGNLPTFHQMQAAIARGLYDVYRASSYRMYGEPLRGQYSHRFGYGIPCSEAIDHIAELGPLIEVGAGNGFWTYWLRRAGCDVVAADPQAPDPYTGHAWIDDMLIEDGVQAVLRNPGRSILMVWPRYDTLWPTHVVHAMRATQVLCYVGEGPFGASAHPSTFAALQARGFTLTRLLSVPNWPMSSGHLAIYAKGDRQT